LLRYLKKIFYNSVAELRVYYYYQDGTRTAYTRVGNIDIEGYAHDMGFTSYPSGCQQTFL
ncbi:hypothetical protein, partial [Parabacteroides distasonis]|uniref:hypothetical protein n=1 Tax=Parabacteroides distasonis TaxID=823 RepID=UPI001C6FF5A6